VGGYGPDLLKSIFQSFGIFTVTGTVQKQCCGSGSVPKFLGFLDPDLLVRSTYGSGSYHQAKIVRKTMIPTVLELFFDLLSLKNDVNVASKVTRNKFFLCHLEVTDENSRMRSRTWSRIPIRTFSSEVRIRGSGSVPKYHGSATLFQRGQNRSWCSAVQ
jgi:hypothetical protein